MPASRAMQSVLLTVQSMVPEVALASLTRLHVPFSAHSNSSKSARTTPLADQVPSAVNWSVL